MRTSRWFVAAFGLTLLMVGDTARTVEPDKSGVVKDDKPGQPTLRAAGEPEPRYLPPAPADGWQLGVQVESLTTGVRITRVMPGTPAAEVGLERNDVIVTVDGQQVGWVRGTLYELGDVLAEQVGRRGRVRLLVQNVRGGGLVNVDVQLSRPEPPRPPVPPKPPEDMIPVVQKLCRKYLGRDLKPWEVDAWRKHFERGGSVNDIHVSILSGREFYALAGNTDERYVRAVFERMLGRQPTPNELRTWLNELAAQGNDRTRFMRKFVNQMQPID